MFVNENFKSIFATNVFDRDTVQFYANNIGLIVEHLGFSVGSTSFETEMKKVFVRGQDQLRVVFEIILEKQSQQPKGIKLEGDSEELGEDSEDDSEKLGEDSEEMWILPRGFRVQVVSVNSYK